MSKKKNKYKWLWFLPMVLFGILSFFVYFVDRAFMGLFLKHYESFNQWRKNEVVRKIYPKKEHGLIVEVRQIPVSLVRVLTLTTILWLILF